MLSPTQIAAFAYGPGVVRASVRSFLSKLGSRTEDSARAFFRSEKVFLKWNAATQAAILRGLRAHYAGPTTAPVLHFPISRLAASAFQTQGAHERAMLAKGFQHPAALAPGMNVLVSLDNGWEGYGTILRVFRNGKALVGGQGNRHPRAIFVRGGS
jgi:hypothetical protein